MNPLYNAPVRVHLTLLGEFMEPYKEIHIQTKDFIKPTNMRK